MGEEAIPLILEDLRTEGGMWYRALSALTGVKVIREEDRGKVDAIDAAWINWGVREGYITTTADKR